MKGIVQDKHKHMLWKDEVGETFLLLKYAEVYQHSESILRLHIWQEKVLAVLRIKGWILKEIETDDRFFIADVDISILDALILLGAHKIRPHIKGKWIKHKEKLLAHKIFPYRPRIRTKTLKTSVRGCTN